MTPDKPSFISELYAEWQSLTTARKWLYFLYSILLIDLILSFFRAVEGRIGLGFIQPISNAIFIFAAAVGSFPVFRKNVKAKDIFLLLALIIFHHISAVIHVGTALYAARNAVRFVFYCLPLFLVGLTVDTKTSLKLFVGMSYVALFLQLVSLYYFGVGINVVGEAEGMTAAYNLLPFACFLVWYAFNQGGIWHIFIAVFSVFLLLSLGARGPVVCLGFFVATYLLLFKKYKYRILSRLLICAAAAAIYIFSFEISFAFTGVASRLKLSTRVYESIVAEQMADFEESNGRNDVWRETLKTLKDNEILFDANLYADRLYTGHDSYYDNDRTLGRDEIDFFSGSIYQNLEADLGNGMDSNSRYRHGWYAHNLELELLCDFGLIGGLIVIIWLLSIIIKAFRLTWNTNATIMLLVFFTTSIMQLQFSNSYLREPTFWFFLGMCVSCIRENNESTSINIR